MLIMPVVNSVLPRPGGRISGAFIMEQGGQFLAQAGVGGEILVCPWIPVEQALFPVGIITRLRDAEVQKVADPETGATVPVLIAVLEGRGYARWNTLRQYKGMFVSADIENLDFRQTRKDYPVITGAGWIPEGGYTEAKDDTDIRVTIYGTDLETDREVNISANLCGLVSKEQAHTIEHAVIRALRTNGLCSAKTLSQAIREEGQELQRSVEMSIRCVLPEALGISATGACGNPLTNLANIYLARDLVHSLSSGQNVQDSLMKARQQTMSKLTQDMGLTTQPGLRSVMGLKKGMSHDDTPLPLTTAKAVIARFPLSPWE